MDYCTYKTREHLARERRGLAIDTRLLDGLSDPALYALGERLSRTPKGGKGRIGSVRERTLNYLDKVLRVRELRRKGNYGTARAVEMEADAVFAGLPRFVRL